MNKIIQKICVYQSSLVTENLKNNSITCSIYLSKFQSNSRFYEASRLGMSPKDYKAKGKNQNIMLAVGQCSLGNILIGKTSRGICCIFLGDNPQEVIDEFERTYQHATVITGDNEFNQYVSYIIGFIDKQDNILNHQINLPLDIQGTVFQQKVWSALQKIPYGTTLTYSEVAQKIGHPKAIRAVANACASNLLAIAIPCHRVIQKNGSLSGYRWGVHRKEKILIQEKK